MGIEDSFEMETIVQAGVELSESEVEELEGFLQYFVTHYTENASESEGELNLLDISVAVAGLAFQAGRAYQTQNTEVVVSMSTNTVQQFITFLTERTR